MCLTMSARLLYISKHRHFLDGQMKAKSRGQLFFKIDYAKVLLHI